VRSALLTHDFRNKYRLPIYTLRVPLHRLYVVNAPELIHAVQSRANALTLVPNLLDFGMLFSGVDAKSRRILNGLGYHNANPLTKATNKWLNSKSSLEAVTRTALGELVPMIRASFSPPNPIGLLETFRHALTLAMTGAIYGPGNPFYDPDIERSWQ
jgi:hypothetical protein